MKKYFYFPTWEEPKDVMISLDESFIITDYTRFLNLYSESSSNTDAIKTIEKHHKGEKLSVSEIDVVQSLKASTLSTEIKDGCERAKSYVVNKYKIYQSTPSDPIKQKLSELTGAKWYGDYVVLEVYNYNEDDYIATQGDLLQNTLILLETYCSNDGSYKQSSIQCVLINNIDVLVVGVCEENAHCFNIPEIYSYKEMEEQGNYYYKDCYPENIFEQYSLFLQGKENKWEEVKNVLDI